MSMKAGLLPLSRNSTGHRRPLSSFVKGGAGLMVTALFDMAVAFSTGYWATWNNKQTGEHGGFGLWKMWHCQLVHNSDEEGASSVDTQCQEKWADTTFAVWHITSQVMAATGLALLFISFILLLVYIFMPVCYRNRKIMASIIGTSYSSGFFSLVALCVFGAKVVEGISDSNSEWFLSWSFSLACTSFVLNAIAASILMTENNRLNLEEANMLKSGRASFNSENKQNLKEMDNMLDNDS